MLKIIAAYLGAGLAMAALDALWLGFAAPRIYRPLLRPMLAQEFSLPPAVLFYLIYVAGIVGLAVLPAAREGGLGRAMALGAALGFVAYATYDLTNLATLKHWSWTVSAIDMAWGAVLTALAAAAGLAALRLAEARL